MAKGKIIKLLYGNDNLVRGVEHLNTERCCYITIGVHNDFNDNRDNNDKNGNNDDDENDNVNSDSLDPRDDLDDLQDKTDLTENRKSKRVAAINADIIPRLNDENFE